MSDKKTQEIELLREIATRPPIGKAIGYFSLSGPGLLQTGMTIGAGSAAASVVAGASFGYKLLWVQPVAMFLGIMMFMALSNIVLTVRERPYWSFMGEARKIWGPLVILIFLWGFGSVMASIIWHFPQYGLAAGAVRSIVQEFSPGSELQKPVYRTDEIGNRVLFRITDEGGTGVYAINAEGNPIPSTDAEGNRIYVANQAGRHILFRLISREDELIPATDAEGNRIYVLDEEGNRIYATDAEGNRTYVLGEDGNPVYEYITFKHKVTGKAFTGLGFFVSFAAGLTILLMNLIVVFNYGRGGIGIRIYEWFMRGIIALVFFTFLLVVLMNINKIEWLEMLKGFIGWYGIPYHEDPEQFRNTVILVLGMVGASVGINMTFMYPYTQLKKGWGPEHKTLAKWDLGLTMFLPFVVITSLVMIGMTVSGVYTGEDVVNRAISPLAAAAALEGGFISQRLATIIFCAGLIGMACGAIAAHMTCCGFVLNEMLGWEPTTWRFRLFALTPAIGIFGVIAPLPIWFPVVASAIALTMLPIAYLTFLILNNRRSYIGDAVGKGLKRTVFNTLLVIALLVAIIGSTTEINRRVITPLADRFFSPAVEQTVEIESAILEELPLEEELEETDGEDGE